MYNLSKGRAKDMIREKVQFTKNQRNETKWILKNALLSYLGSNKNIFKKNYIKMSLL